MNVDKLVSLGCVKHAALSMASSDSSIFLRALALASLLTDDNEGASDSLLETDCLKYVLGALNSANDAYRLEALNILKNVTEHRPPVKKLKEYDISTKLIILLEEGLELDTDVGRLQAYLVLKILGHLGKYTEEFADALYNHG